MTRFGSFILTVVLALVFALTSFASNALWYEAQGHAVIENNDVQAAKMEATQNALKKALLVAGASVSSIRQVVNGLLVENEFNIRASGNINSVDLINETRTGNLLTVSIRADILPQQRQCFSSDYRKPLVITKSHIRHRDHAIVGELFDLDYAFSQKLKSHFQDHSQFIDSRVYLDAKNGFARLLKSDDSDELQRLPVTIAQRTDSQFVVFTEITDLSLSKNDGEGSLLFWQEKHYPRNFGANVYLFSGSNGELVHQQSYSDTAMWDYDKRDVVNVNNSDFWHSRYGAMLTTVMDKITNDIDQSLMCEPSRASILSVNNNQITINLGSHNGVKIGDELTLMHETNFISNDGRLRKSYTVSEHQVVVTNLTRNIATAATTDNKNLGNIQKGDWAVRM